MQKRHHRTDERIYPVRRGGDGASIRRLDSMSKREAIANRGKAARTDYRIAYVADATLKFPVAMRLGDTPVLIPNTMVKTLAADGTMLETVWESRWLPESFQK